METYMFSMRSLAAAAVATWTRCWAISSLNFRISSGVTIVDGGADNGRD